jgi:hypothetical protein
VRADRPVLRMKGHRQKGLYLFEIGSLLLRRVARRRPKRLANLIGGDAIT